MIDQAVEILRRGGLVAFPTETVYGLGADATNPHAVGRIFSAKQRPATNPLIVHVADAIIARRYTIAWPEPADILAKTFWPGPLTLVLPKSDSIVDAVTAGLGSVGVRVPAHPVALELLRKFDGPIAAPSANRANHISPTQAHHVREELADSVDMVLDGGPCTVGIESTVIDLTTEKPIILRPGGISRQQIESAIGPVDAFEGHTDKNSAAVSPGQHVRHYSPNSQAFWFPDRMLNHVLQQAGGVVIIIGQQTGGENIVQMSDDPQRYAQQLYRVLREADAQQPAAIFIQMPPDLPAWAAVRDRLSRAALPL